MKKHPFTSQLQVDIIVAIVKLLLEASANPDKEDNSALIPVFKSLFWGTAAVEKILIEHANINSNLYSTEQRISLHWVAISGRADIVRILLGSNLLNPDALCYKDQMPLHCVVIFNYRRVIEVLIEQGDFDPHWRDIDGPTTLSYAAQHGTERVVRLLLNSGARKNDTADNFGDTPFISTTARGLKGWMEILSN